MAQRHLSERARKFLREVGSIVLGVLIALGIGEVADGVRHRANAKRAINAVQIEMASTGIYLEERMMKGRCLTRRLETLRAELAVTRRKGGSLNIKVVGRPNTRPLANAAWETFVGSGETLYTAAYRYQLARRYFALQGTYLQLQNEEQQSWARLRVLENRSGTIGDDLMAELEMTIEDARISAAALNIMARQMWLLQNRLGISTNYNSYKEKWSFAEALADVRSSPVCLPLVAEHGDK